MNLQILLRTKVNEYRQDILDEFYKIFYSMGMILNEKVELSFHELKYVAQILYTQWRDNWTLRAGPISLEVFRKEFVDRFFTREKSEAKLE